MSEYTQQDADAELAASHAETNVVNHEPELATSLLQDQVQEEMIRKRKSLRSFQAYHELHGILFERVIAALPGPQDNYTFGPCESSLDIRIATDKATLNAIVQVLRKQGFSPDSRPSEGDTTWSSYWSHQVTAANIWFSFSSTECKRVKVGTEMVEQTVYETQCADGNLLEDQV